MPAADNLIRLAILGLELVCCTALTFCLVSNPSNFFWCWLCFSFEFSAYQSTGSIYPKRTAIIIVDVFFRNIIEMDLGHTLSNHNILISYSIDISYIYIIGCSYMFMDNLLPRNIQRFS